MLTSCSLVRIERERGTSIFSALWLGFDKKMDGLQKKSTQESLKLQGSLYIHTIVCYRYSIGILFIQFI